LSKAYPKDAAGNGGSIRLHARYPQLQQMWDGAVWQAVLFVYRKSTFCLITREVLFAILVPVSASRKSLSKPSNTPPE
jgi:hypothetical protein